jgi:plastocyanin
LTGTLTTIRLVLVASLLGCCLPVLAQQATVEGEIHIKHLGDSKADNSNVVVWLVPLDHNAAEVPARAGSYRILQKNKEFHPHVLAVPVGTPVEFPNEDPFFHNVFSLYKGKRFDLGLYEAGSSRKVVFDKPGVSFIFCNIHPEMNAYVLALNSPYFDTSGRRGQVKIANVPYGRYRMEFWYERAEASDLARLSREVEVNDLFVKLGNIEIADSPRFQPKHLNKHGAPYDPESTPY